MSQAQRDNLKALYKGKKHVPLDLKNKQTRAIRRRLSPEDQKRVTLRQHKKNIHFFKKRYAVKQ
jgi:large subunit ribosomal protein L35e